MNVAKLTSAMTDALVGHVPGAVKLDEQTVQLPFADLRARTRVQRVVNQRIVQQHIWLTGGPLGTRWIEDNFAGLGTEPLESTVRGVHEWVKGNFQAVRLAFEGGAPAAQLVYDGIEHDVFVSPRGVRGRRGNLLSAMFDGPLCLPVAPHLPVLHPSGPTFVGTFIAPADGDSVTMEVKVDGSDWPAAQAGFGAVRWPHTGDYASVRELAILVPKRARETWPSVETIHRTLRGLPVSEGGEHAFGSEMHRYELAPPLAETDAGLPEDLAWFVTHVGSAGAGPGYGLLSPAHPAQATLRSGVFDGTAPRGVLALAHHGCGAMTLLILRGPHRGEVWVDGRCNDEGMRKIAGSFRDYYEGWLLDVARRVPPQRLINPERCAMLGALSSFLEAWDEKHPGGDSRNATAALTDAAIVISARGGDYFEEGDTLALCAGCWRIGRQLGLLPRHVARGLPPKQGR